VPEDMQLQPTFAVVVCGTNVAVTSPYIDQLRRISPPDVDLIGPMPYLDLQGMLDAGAPRGLRQYWKSGCLRTLDARLLEQIVAAALQPASPFAQIHLHQMGGAVGGPARADRAISSLAEASWVLNIVGTWMDPATDAENIAWVRDLWARAEPHTVAAYTNFLGEEGFDRVRSAISDSASRRLVVLKQQWDPDNVFRLNQNIPPET
jgi:hypothetical protein